MFGDLLSEQALLPKSFALERPAEARLGFLLCKEEAPRLVALDDHQAQTLNALRNRRWLQRITSFA